MEIFVFGSNLAGRHGKGAALFARQTHGAKYGVGRGLTGRSYALPTKDKAIQTLPIQDVEFNVKEFIKFAEEHPEATFNVTKVGCGLAGFSEAQIAPMFRYAPTNCNLPTNW